MAIRQATNVQMHSFTASENHSMKRASLVTMLKQQPSQNYDLEQITLILGGAEKILYDYLSSSDIALNHNQLTQLEQIITSQNPIKSTQTH